MGNSVRPIVLVFAAAGAVAMLYVGFFVIRHMSALNGG